MNDSSIEVTVESKADDTYPIVSASSICAKVTRDHALNDFVFAEKHITFSANYGCGYPGDKITRGWLKDNVDPVFGFPSNVRFSWKTSFEMLAKEDKKFDWHDIPESILNGSNLNEIKKAKIKQLE